jgi:hypothetical protein
VAAATFLLCLVPPAGRGAAADGPGPRQPLPVGPDTVATVVGSVLDDASGRPLPGSLVVLRDETSRARWALTTDHDGGFVVRDIPGGSFRIEASRLGYGAASAWISLRPGQELELELRLATEAIALEPVTVRAPAVSPRIEAFHQRRARGLGRFLGREEIESRGAGRVTDLLRTFAGVRIVSGPAFSDEVLLRNCRPDLFIDGIHLAPPVFVDDLVAPGDLEGIEIYGVAEVPPQFARGNCGALVLWTRVGAPGEGRPLSWRRLLVLAGILLGVIALR